MRTTLLGKKKVRPSTKVTRFSRKTKFKHLNRGQIKTFLSSFLGISSENLNTSNTTRPFRSEFVLVLNSHKTTLVVECVGIIPFQHGMPFASKPKPRCCCWYPLGFRSENKQFNFSYCYDRKGLTWGFVIGFEAEDGEGGEEIELRKVRLIHAAVDARNLNWVDCSDHERQYFWYELLGEEIIWIDLLLVRRKD